MTRVLVAVDDSESSVHAAETAHRLFGDTAEYLAVNVTNIVDLASIPWYGAGWGSPYAAPYGAVWAYRSDVTLDPEGIADGQKTAEAQAQAVADESGLPAAEAVGEEGDPADAVLRVHVGGSTGHSRSGSVTTIGVEPAASPPPVGSRMMLTGRWKQRTNAGSSRALNASMYRA